MNCPFCYKALESHERFLLKGMIVYMCEKCPKDKPWIINLKVVHPDDKVK